MEAETQNCPFSYWKSLADYLYDKLLLNKYEFPLLSCDWLSKTKMYEFNIFFLTFFYFVIWTTPMFLFNFYVPVTQKMYLKTRISYLEVIIKILMKTLLML